MKKEWNNIGRLDRVLFFVKKNICLKNWDVSKITGMVQ